MYFSATRVALAALLLAAPFTTLAQGVGIGTTAPDVSAALDIVSTTKGALLPRVASAAAIATPATGLLVFQTGSPAGFYYNAGTPALPAWQCLDAALTAANGLTRTGQELALGGALTQATTLDQRTNNLLLTGTGNLGVGTATPTARLDVSGTLRVGNPLSSAQISQPLGTGGGASIMTGQSFTLPVGAVIRTIDVFVYGGSGTFAVYQGAPGNGPALSSQTVTYTAGYGPTTVTLATPVVVTAPGVYSFQASGAPYYIFASSDVYPGGHAYSIFGDENTYDLKFNVGYDVVPPATLNVTAGGQVGIGTDSPAAALDVNGPARLRGLTTTGSLDVSGSLRLAVRVCPTNVGAAYTLTSTDIGYSIFRLQNGNFNTPLTLPAFGSGQTDGQELTIVSTATTAASIAGTNTDNAASIALASIGTAGIHSVRYIWNTTSASTGVWVRVQ